MVDTVYKLYNRKVLFAIVLLGCLGALSFTTRASATLAGQDGLILYVENDDEAYCELEVPTITEVQVEDESCPAPENEVITTAPDGTSPTVAATESNPITAATISAPNTNGNNEIVYAVSEPYCLSYDEWLKTSESIVIPEVDREPCNGGWMYKPFNNNVVLQHVEVDADGNPLAAPTTILDLAPTDPNSPSFQEVEKLSYSPDGTAVVMTRVEETSGMYDRSTPLWTVEKVLVDSGVIQTLVDPRFDPWVSAGYAQDGSVYFSRTNDEYDNEDQGLYEEYFNVDLWMIPAGGSKTDARQVTFSGGINEYFLSMSPDSSRALVCDPESGYYYYYVNVADGSVLQLVLEDGFLPIGFSPSGLALLGNLNSYNPMESGCGGRIALAAAVDLEAVTLEEFAEGIATALRTNLQNPSVINTDLRGVEDWAPKYVATTTVVSTPKVLSATTFSAAKLQSTGTSTMLSALVGSVIALVAATTLAYRKNEN